jgi:hypothetical protein
MMNGEELASFYQKKDFESLFVANYAPKEIAYDLYVTEQLKKLHKQGVILEWT